MTQLATPETVLAPFDNEQLEFDGQLYRLERNGDRFFVSVVNPKFVADSASDVSGVDRREIVMTTGSHHLQVYWIFEPSTQTLIELPFYHHLAEKRWILRDDTMLHPPGQPQMPSRWNDRCIKCHSVNGVPGLDSERQRFQTHVAELGIACEACHGPGQRHMASQENPFQKKTGSAGDLRIVNPKHLGAKAATQVCGRCHSASEPLDSAGYLKSGLAFHPGEDLHKFVALNRFDPHSERRQGQLGAYVENYALDGFWRDGTCRVGGDEYNALIESPCYERGNLSCLSCHSLHQSDPNDQLSEEARDNRACTQCHKQKEFNRDLASHTHHAEQSSGSLCYNCHMPYISYALLTAMRSHRVNSPSAMETVQTGKPNACNLCHLDRTLEWTSRCLADWYGREEPSLPENEKNIAASVLWLEQGDAALRIITAWHMGWACAQEASGNDWQAALLAGSLNDPYAAIRFVASKSLKTLPGFERWDYDFIGPPEGRREAVKTALETWKSIRSPNREPLDRTSVLIDAKGELRTGEVERLLRLRDEHPVSIAE